MDETYIAGRLARLRTQMGVSARDMSLTIGQANNYISNIENGKSAPSIQGFFYICDYLKISPKDFFDQGNDNPALLNELMTELRPLNTAALEHILGLIANFAKNHSLCAPKNTAESQQTVTIQTAFEVCPRLDSTARCTVRVSRRDRRRIYFPFRSHDGRFG